MHLVLRGHNREPIFYDAKDRHVVLDYLGEVLSEEPVHLHAYVLMTNHVHLLATGHEEGAISRFMHRWSRRYSFYFNRSRGRSGSLFEGRFRSSPVEFDRYLLACMRYIENNPVRARICGSARQFPWSSHGANASGNPSAPLVPHPVYSELGSDARSRAIAYDQLFNQDVAPAEIESFRMEIRPRPIGWPGHRAQE